MRGINGRHLNFHGFVQGEYRAQYYADFRKEFTSLIKDGTFVYLTDIVAGLDNAPEAFIGLLDGANTGKLVVEVKKPT